MSRSDDTISIPPVVSLGEVPAGAVFVDVRWTTQGGSDRSAYLAGHIPGARFVDLDASLAGEARPIAGRHPLPTPSAFAADLAAAGVADDAVVIAYDDAGGVPAARLVWMLRALGQSAALLDGGLAAWPGEFESGAVLVPAATRTVTPWPVEAMVDADGVASAVEAGVMVADARANDRFHGAPSPLDPRPGHVPGAISLPFTTVLDADGRYRAAGDLTVTFDEAGLDGDGIVYCGSGVSACVLALAVERSGRGLPRLYVGSWSGWASDPTRSVE